MSEVSPTTHQPDEADEPTSPAAGHQLCPVNRWSVVVRTSHLDSSTKIYVEPGMPVEELIRALATYLPIGSTLAENVSVLRFNGPRPHTA